MILSRVELFLSLSQPSMINSKTMVSYVFFYCPSKESCYVMDYDRETALEDALDFGLSGNFVAWHWSCMPSHEAKCEVFTAGLNLSLFSSELNWTCH